LFDRTETIDKADFHHILNHLRVEHGLPEVPESVFNMVFTGDELTKEELVEQMKGLMGHPTTLAEVDGGDGVDVDDADGADAGEGDEVVVEGS
jgi:hypothetical protein